MNKYIYKGIVILLLSVVGIKPSVAQWIQSVPGISVRNQELTRNADMMTVAMDLNLSELELKSNSAAIFVPMLINGENKRSLSAVGVYGHMSWYQSIRSGNMPLGGRDEISYKYNARPSVLTYKGVARYEEWMEGSDLILVRYDYGCCSEQMAEYSKVLGRYGEKPVQLEPYKPVFHYVRPVAEVVKERALAGSAYIDFPVNSTELYTDFRNNRSELAKIVATIDSIRNDRDITVTSVLIKGSASPEGSYENNARLAKGRTDALKAYVTDLFHFEPDFITTDYVPEDWDGLRKYVASSGLNHKYEILSIIDNPSMDIDAKDRRIQSLYGNEYIYLLENVYPSLRRSDYRISYSVRSYNDVKTIREIMSVAPQKLSLSEMYLLSQTMEEGSDEYNDLFELAARLYPTDAAANINAANAAMSRGALHRAARYLENAGESAEAVYARGVYSALRGDKAAAERLIRRSGELGISHTDAVIEHIRNSQVGDNQ